MQICIKFILTFSGYYADVEARCQVFRVCANTDLTGKGISKCMRVAIFF